MPQLLCSGILVLVIWLGSAVSETIVIAGGSLSSHCGKCELDIILIEPTDWPGGQLTSSNVPPDFGKENSLPQNLPHSFVSLIEQSINDPNWQQNPGKCWVSYKCFEAQLAAEYIRKTLLPQYPRLKVFYNTVVKKATLDKATR